MVISAHVSRYTAVALAGFTALSLAACGSSATPSTSTTSSKPASSSTTSASRTPSPTPGAAGQGSKDGKDGRDRAFGLVGSVSGSTVTLSGPNGSATVDVSPSTRVTELAPAQLTDVTAGECVVVRPTKDSGGAPSVTAAAVLVSLAGNGQCGGHGHGRGVTGTVASVNGSSIVLTAANNSQTSVTVTSSTRYAKRTNADTSAIAAGQCLAARGTKDGSGNLQATAVNLQPADNGQCGGGKHHDG
jgi:ABC-type Fe3+-hydroxamate transport system substrate-binding protein